MDFLSLVQNRRYGISHSGGIQNYLYVSSLLKLFSLTFILTIFHNEYGEYHNVHA